MTNPVLIDVDALVDSMKEQLREIARKELGGYIGRLLADVNAFIVDAISDIRIWAIQLVAGQIDHMEFSFLIGGLSDRMTLHAISQTGAAIVTIQRIRNAVIDLIISSVIKVVLP